MSRSIVQSCAACATTFSGRFAYLAWRFRQKTRQNEAIEEDCATLHNPPERKVVQPALLETQSPPLRGLARPSKSTDQERCRSRRRCASH
jgi:hypothetical protein